MDRELKEDAMSRSTVTSPNARKQAKAPLALRIVLMVVAAVVLAVGIVSAGNIMAVNAYNQATQSLESNIKAAGKDAADLDMLKTSQQQNDKQFADALAFNALLVPSAKASIESNAATSRKLTSLIEKALKQQESSQQGSSGSQAESDKKSNSSETSGLSNEEREKVQELLKQNQQTQSPSPSASSSSSNTSTSENVKPW